MRRQSKSLQRRLRLGLIVGGAAVLAIATVVLYVVQANAAHMTKAEGLLRQKVLMTTTHRRVPPAFLPTSPSPIPSTTPPVPADMNQVLTCDAIGCGGGSGPLPQGSFDATTQYTTLASNGSVLLAVWAGSLPDAPSQGAIRVYASWYSTFQESPPPGGGIFLLPGSTGPLTITAVQGVVVTFTYPGGHGTFNLGTDQFSA